MSTEATVEVAAEATAPVVKVEVPKIPIKEAAAAIAAAVPGLKVRETKSTTYQVIGTSENTEDNWKKGLFFEVSQYAAGLLVELKLYSPKKSAHLAEFKGEFNQFAGAKIGEAVVEQLPCGLATRLRVKFPFALGLETIVAQSLEFIALVSPTVEAVRAKIVFAAKPVKAAKKVKAEKAEGKAEGKKAGKAKTKKPVTKVAPATADLNPEIAAAVQGIEIPAM